MPSPIGHALAGIAVGVGVWRSAVGARLGTRVLGFGPRASGLGSRLAGSDLNFRFENRDLTPTLAFAAAGMAPDIDLLFGAHSGPTHGIGAAILVGALAFGFAGRSCVGVRRSALGARVLFAVALAAAYASHILLDWLGSDTSAPIGIMALWPFSGEYYESSAHVFMAISRRYWLPEFWAHNVVAVVRELVILVPIVGIVLWVSRRRATNQHLSLSNGDRASSQEK